jgi:hypothetical protein
MAENYVPVYREAQTIQDVTLISSELLIQKKDQFEAWLRDSEMSQRQREETTRLLGFVSFELSMRG